MRPYAIYEHPDFSLSSGSLSTPHIVVATMAVVAASSAALYELIIHTSIKESFWRL
ncbi:hypothetical protein BDN67DRAFT_960531 [Paxillus ammoniavirescens]|nr:hypothetical protein BDN67DRAFT_960531 [Paxillus ammoniavirescens]